MTDSVLEGVAPDVREKGRRPRWLTPLIATAVVVLVASLVTITWTRHLDRQYGPIEQGNFGGPYSGRGFVDSKDGFSYSLSPAPGATGQLITAVNNLGSHSVKVTSIDTDDIVTDVRWSAYEVPGPGGLISGKNTPWHQFPATVPARGTIRLLITIRHPDNCNKYPSLDAAEYDGQHTVHWESLLHDHTTVIDDGLGLRNIRVC